MISMAQETDDDEFDNNESGDHSESRNTGPNDQSIVRNLTEVLAGSRGKFNLPYFEDGQLSPATIQWACSQLRMHVDTIWMTHLHVYANWLVADGNVKEMEDMAEFIRKSPSLSSVDFDGDETAKTDILVLAAAENKGIKTVTLQGHRSVTPEAVIAVLKAGHVETLILEVEDSNSLCITEDQREALVDALLMSPELSYVSFYPDLFAICVLEKLSHGGKTKMKSLTVSVIIHSCDQYEYQELTTVDSLVNCVTSPRANVQTLQLRTDYGRGPHQRCEVIFPNMDFKIEPDNMNSETIIHLACDIRDDCPAHPIDWIDLINLLGVDARDDNWLETVMSMPELEHLELYSPYNLRDTDIDSLLGALSLRSIGFSFMEDFIIDPSRICPTISYLVARGSLKQASIEGLHIDYQGWANLSEFLISSTPSLRQVNLSVYIQQKEGAFQDGNADGFPATTAQMPQALKNPSWNMSKSLLAEFLWSLHSLTPEQFCCNLVFSDEGSVHSITCDADFDQPAWQCLCKMLADASCAIERVELCKPYRFAHNCTRLHPLFGDPIWAALDSNSSLKYCKLENHEEDWNDMVLYYTTRNKLNDLLSGDETSTMKLWVPAVEAVRNQYHGKSLIFHLVQAKPLLFVREGE